MKHVLRIVAIALLFLLAPLEHSSSQQASKSSSASQGSDVGGAGQKGVCCLCTLSYNGIEFAWSCPCTNGQGAEGCTIDVDGCTNVGVCP